jgi:hypothetical protein
MTRFPRPARRMTYPRTIKGIGACGPLPLPLFCLDSPVLRPVAA